jgi:hypothetical protein
MSLGNEDRLDGVAGADIEQPLACAVGSGGVTQHARRGYRRALRKPLTQRPGHVGHGAEIVDPRVVDPAQQLSRAVGLLAQLGAKAPQCFLVQSEKVDGHGRNALNASRFPVS